MVGVLCKKVYWKWGTVAINYTLCLNVNYSKIGIFEIGNYDFDLRFIQRKTKNSKFVSLSTYFYNCRADLTVK